MFQLKRQAMMVEICKDAEDTIATVLDYSSRGSVSLTAKGNGSRPLICKPSLHKFAFYMGCLHNVGLWHWRDDFDGDPSIGMTLKQLAEVSQERRPGKCALRGSVCLSCNFDIGHDLCLRCVKKGDYTDEAFRKTCPNHGLMMGE
jgi:hypothetical protein